MLEPFDDFRNLAERALPHRENSEPLFRLAWQARVFSLVVSLVKDGTITWASFQERLVHHISQTKPDSVCQSAEEIDLLYFECWLEAAQEVLVAVGHISDQNVNDRIDHIREKVEITRIEQLL